MNNIKKLIFDTIVVIVGNALLAFGTVAFLVPSHIIAGGATGISLILEKFIPISLSTSVFIINIIMFFIGLIFIGKKFTSGTVLSSFLYPFFLAIFERIPGITTITNDMFLYVIYAGLFIGLGCGIVLREGYSTGGMDVIPVLINKKTGSSVALWMNITDTIILVGQILFSTPEQVLYGILVVFITSFVIDRVMLLGERNLQVIIISPEYETIAERIDQELQRGSTFIKVTTGYMKNEQKAVLSVISRRQLMNMNTLVHSIDHDAFMITSEIHSVKGRGFTLPNIEL
jgi:uncharacterized membrane-anchored protein YitT (DUF2179 family)